MRRRLNRSFEDLTVRFRVRDYPTVLAIPNWAGKYKDFTIQRRTRKSFTAIAQLPLNKKLGEVAEQFRKPHTPKGCVGLAALEKLRGLEV